MTASEEWRTVLMNGHRNVQPSTCAGRVYCRRPVSLPCWRLYLLWSYSLICYILFVLFLSLQFDYLFAYIVGNDNINQKTSVFPYFFLNFPKLVIVYMFAIRQN